MLSNMLKPKGKQSKIVPVTSYFGGNREGNIQTNAADISLLEQSRMTGT
jgi:hypothetical protein